MPASAQPAFLCVVRRLAVVAANRLLTAPERVFQSPAYNNSGFRVYCQPEACSTSGSNNHGRPRVLHVRMEEIRGVPGTVIIAGLPLFSGAGRSQF
jgi:hypothetical protein